MINILYLVNCEYIQKKMSRIRFFSIQEISKHNDVKLTITGNGFPNFDSKKSLLEIINKKYDFIICYKPCEYIDFCKLDTIRIIRYNEMYNEKETLDEIKFAKPHIIICHHENDYIYYSNKYKELDSQFYYIPHCVNSNIFKKYNLEKKYDITFSGAIGNSILGDHYPLRTRLLKICLKLSNQKKINFYYHKHPGYTLEDAYTNKYSIELSKIYNQSKICITCSGAPKTRFAKYIEIPASNSIVLGDIPDEPSHISELKKCIIEVNNSMNDRELEEIILKSLNNKQLLEEKLKYSLIYSSKYTQKYYSNKFVSILKEYQKSINNNIIQFLWIGSPLSNIEIGSIKSFLDNHQVHLYIYNELNPEILINLKKHDIFKNKNFSIKDGNDILKANEIFTYKNGSYSAFSNLFRYMLIYKKGGYWCDLDLINIKQLNLSKDYVIVSEPSVDYKKNIPTTCLIKMPQYSQIALECYNLCLKYKADVLSGRMEWGLGPLVLKKILDRYNLNNIIENWDFVCFCHPNDTINFFKNYDEVNISKNTYCIHLWNKVLNEFNLKSKIENFKDSFINKLLQ